jgi:hypothetical protein
VVSPVQFVDPVATAAAPFYAKSNGCANDRVIAMNPATQTCELTLVTAVAPAIEGDITTGIVNISHPAVAGTYSRRTSGRLKLINLGQQNEVARTLYTSSTGNFTARTSGRGARQSDCANVAVEGACIDCKGTASFLDDRDGEQHLRGRLHAERRAGVERTDVGAGRHTIRNRRARDEPEQLVAGRTTRAQESADGAVQLFKHQRRLPGSHRSITLCSPTTTAFAPTRR